MYMYMYIQLYLGHANRTRYSANHPVHVHQELCLATGVLSVGKPPPAVHCHHSQHTHPAEVPQHIVQHGLREDREQNLIIHCK